MNVKIICPYCGYDHETELREEPDAWIGDEPYETVCKCGKRFVIHTIITYSFVTGKLNQE